MSITEKVYLSVIGWLNGWLLGCLTGSMRKNCLGNFKLHPLAEIRRAFCMSCGFVIKFSFLSSLTLPLLPYFPQVPIVSPFLHFQFLILCGKVRLCAYFLFSDCKIASLWGLEGERGRQGEERQARVTNQAHWVTLLDYILFCNVGW